MRYTPFDTQLTLEALEDSTWDPPTSQATPLERSVAELRRRPMKTLSAWELARLIGQHVGLEFLVPYAVQRLVREQEQGAVFLDDDLLTALLNCGEYFRNADAGLTRDLLSFIDQLDDEGAYLPPLIENFRTKIAS
ncbi:contact-dependent growth inhibition system immunity protein [Streptomyces sp. WG-D5]